jgi:hypothetical protein
MKDEALKLALEALTDALNKPMWNRVQMEAAITAIKAALANEALERKAENARELGLDYEPYGFEASIYSNARMKVDVVTGNVSIGTVKKPCGLECDCTDVCKQDDYKALWQQMCERCDELDKKLAQQEHEPVAWKWHQAPVKTSWGDGMVVADLAIDKDHTVSIYCERDQTAKFEAMFTPPQQEHGWTPERIAGMARLKAQQDSRLEPQRTWVGLTNQELADCWDTIPERAMRRVEAKLKEKNT